MASEDSDQFISGFPTVHGSDHFHDRCQAGRTQMLIDLHHFDAGRELLKVLSLRGSQWVLAEERDHHVEEISPPPNDVSVQWLSVVVLTTIDHHHTDTEERLQVMQTLEASRTLSDNELMKHLVAGPVAYAAISVRLPHQAKGEASFSIYKAEHPSQPDQPFLLIVRTLHIVTVSTLQTQ
jgi:hypothetical protein